MKRDRDDLPRVLPEFDHLGVYEVDDAFRRREPADGVSGHHFRRTTAGPDRACLTGKPTIGLSLVLISPTDARAGPGAARLGRLRAHPPHRRGRGARLHDDHAVRERDRRRPAVPALLRDGHRRAGGRVQGDDTARRGSASASRDTARSSDWGWHDALRIMYVNTFARVGERARA